jgi:hypothetical protein
MKSLLMVLAFGLLSSSAFAQEGLETKRYTRVVPSGKNLLVGFFYSLTPDCVSIGEAELRVTKKSEHGTVETLVGMSFPYYPKENIRSKCNQHKVKGTLVNYKAAEKYTGNDEFDLLIIFPAGFAWELHYNMSVR